MTDQPNRPIAIAVVGHTNAGKTSLLRTLSRDKSFGSVSGRHGQTRHVESTSVAIDGHACLRLFDTPGFEDSIALHDYLRQFDGFDSRRGALGAFLKSPEAAARFEQEAKILRLLLDDIDAVFYVVDTTETPHAKFKCELDVLAAGARPVMPILNFVRQPDSRVADWQAVLADRNLHVQVSFDVVAPVAGSERVLYEQLSALLGGHRERLSELVAALEREAQARLHAGLRAVGDLLVDVAACRTQVERENRAEVQRQVAALQAWARQREQRCADALLAIHRFDRDDLAPLDLPTFSGRLDDDLFNPEVLRQAAQRLGRGAAIGAAIGLAADLAVAGISLGAGAVVGGAVGGMVVGSWQNALRWTREKIQGRVDLTVEDAALAVLLARQMQLLHALQGRAHAATERLVFDDGSTTRTGRSAAPPTPMPSPLRKCLNAARAHRDWSRQSEHFADDAQRTDVVERIAQAIRPA